MLWGKKLEPPKPTYYNLIQNFIFSSDLGHTILKKYTKITFQTDKKLNFYRQ